MQIALCHENVLPRRGGAEMYVADLARRLCAAGHNVHLYASQWDETALPRELTIHRLAKPAGGRAKRPWRFSETLMSTLAANRPQVSIGFDKALGTDIYYPLGGLHAASAAHNLLKHRPGFPRLAARLAQKLDRAQRSYSRLERQLITGNGRPLLVANSNLVRQHAVRIYGANAADIPVIHNAIDPNRFAEHDRPAVRAALRQKWSISGDHVLGAIIAMNYRLKGLEPLLRSLARVPTKSPFRLLIVGSSDTKPWKRLAIQLGVMDRVRFLGHCDDVRQVFFASDLLVHPTFYDPCSLVVLEAMACGLPVITTRNNGAGELLPPAAGSVIDDPHDLPKMADTISQWTDNERRKTAAAAARNAAARWTFDHHVQAFEQLFAKIIDRRLKAAG